MIPARALAVAAKRAVNSIRTSISMGTGVPLCKPSMVYIQITDKCNARCVMCNIWHHYDSVQHIDFQTIKKLIDDLARWLGRTHIQLGTGEPFLHPEIMKIVEYGNSKGMLMGTVSNGLIITDKIARDIISSNFFNLNISLDGVEPETHAFTRGVPKAYDRVVSAIDRLLFYKKKLNGKTKLMIKPMIFNRNIDQLVPLAEFANRKGLNGINYQPIQRNNDRCLELRKLEDLEHFAQVISELKEMKRRGYPILNTDRELDAFAQYFADPDERPALLDQKCPVGYTNLWVMDGGVVHFCTSFHAPVGHVDDYGGFAKLWRSPSAGRVREIIAKCERPCVAVCLIRRTLGEQLKRFLTFMRDK